MRTRCTPVSRSAPMRAAAGARRAPGRQGRPPDHAQVTDQHLVGAAHRRARGLEGPQQTGQGVRVGIIDTGIDYTHADFGGPGTRRGIRPRPRPRNTFTPDRQGRRRLRLRRRRLQRGPGDRRVRPMPTRTPTRWTARATAPTSPAPRPATASTTDGTTYTGGYADRTSTPPALSDRPRRRARRAAVRAEGLRLRRAPPASSARPSTGPPTRTVTVTSPTTSTSSTCRWASSYGSPDDPDAVASNNLAALGTVVVASIGNTGDVYEVGGSPGNATRVLAVAASDDGDESSTASRSTPRRHRAGRHRRRQAGQHLRAR